VATPDAELGWSDFKALFAISSCTATYDERLYFLPLALDYLRLNPREGTEYTSDLLYFLSSHAQELRRDELLEEALRAIRSCVDAWTESFSVVHFDLDACRAKGWRLDHDDYVRNADAVKDIVDGLLRYKTHVLLAEELVVQWTAPGRSATAAAWLLEFAREERRTYRYYSKNPAPARLDMVPTKSNARIHAAVTDQDALQIALTEVASTIVPMTESPTYWPDLISQLELTPPDPTESVRRKHISQR
jgi:hypothetical protein